MEVHHQTQLDLFLVSKIKIFQIVAVFFLSSVVFTSGNLAREETNFFKGFGIAKREKLSTQGINLINYFVAQKCFHWG